MVSLGRHGARKGRPSFQSGIFLGKEWSWTVKGNDTLNMMYSGLHWEVEEYETAPVG